VRPRASNDSNENGCQTFLNPCCFKNGEMFPVNNMAIKKVDDHNHFQIFFKGGPMPLQMCKLGIIDMLQKGCT
jgi:hypothetical protein